jgi:protein involved in polysaccharide export with SLBB domain
MSLADLVNLAGGFTYDADYSRIDVARPEYKPGQSLKINLITTALPGGPEQVMSDDQSMGLAPYDHVYVRSIPEYELQQTVLVKGEVKYPGTYAILKDKERLSDLLERAGGLNGRAFPEGAKLYRESDSIGLVVIDLVEVLRNPQSPSNIVLLNGDVIEIPKSRDLVTLTGFVNLNEAYSEDFLTGERSVSVAFRGARSAKYYIDEFAAGVSDRGAKSRIRVQYADGRIKKARGFIFRHYPKVERGSTVYVGARKQKPQKVKSERKADWSVALRDTLAATTAVITILVLVDELSK